MASSSALSSLFGGGAAAVGVPFFTWCGMTMHRAIGTVAALGFPVAIAGAVGYAIAGLDVRSCRLERGLRLPAGVRRHLAASVLVAPYGARLAHR
jgi:uncharacterized membrane protein YfcA